MKSSYQETFKNETLNYLERLHWAYRVGDIKQRKYKKLVVYLLEQLGEVTYETNTLKNKHERPYIGK